MELRQHPLSAAFPAMSADDFQALKDDIESNGQREPVWLLDEMVLDGWHRYTAVTELGMELVKFPFKGDDPVAFVKSANMHRRHLTASQRAIAEVALREWAPAGKPKAEANAAAAAALPATTDAMAKEAKVSPRMIRDAKVVHKAGLSEPVKDGSLTLEEAAAVVRGKPAKKTVAPPAAAPERGQTLPPAEPPPAANDNGMDPLAELEAAHAEIEKLTEEIKAAEADDQKAETLKWRRSYAHAQRQQSEAMDRAKSATDREARTMKHLRRCGKAVGETNPDKIAAAVEALVREVRKAA